MALVAFVLILMALLVLRLVWRVAWRLAGLLVWVLRGGVRVTRRRPIQQTLWMAPCAAPGQVCPWCGGVVVERFSGFYGPFLGCTGFPHCRAAWQQDGSRLAA